MTRTQWIRRVGKPLVFLTALAPTGWIIWEGVTDNLTANPIQELEHQTGLWLLRFLCITLAVTPLRRLTGWNDLIRFRRMLGLFAFYYGCLHFLTYFCLDQFFNLRAIMADIVKRPYITVGFTGFVLMIPLAVTSTAAMIRRLGGRRWQLLHRLIYVSAVAGVIHYWWSVKADIRSPERYAIAVAVLLGFRLLYAAVKSRQRLRPAPAAALRPPFARFSAIERDGSPD
ncbi:MAG TPA: protein-methionine-sulfoxide reductase heme-binding subunit MsrQ [Vicinamibacterales bacterium]|nr:protein-methionine-sulfoxide reductase heme-binding subunit MsrQ [Vicinamibacterales bacterium]